MSQTLRNIADQNPCPPERGCPSASAACSRAQTSLSVPAATITNRMDGACFLYKANAYKKKSAGK